MAFHSKRRPLPSTAVLVLGVVAMTDSESGPIKVKLANIGAAAAEDQGMQFNISETIGV